MGIGLVKSELITSLVSVREQKSDKSDNPIQER